MKLASFKSYITEAFATGDLGKAMGLVTKYLKKKTGLAFFVYPGVEQGNQIGIRLYSPKSNYSVRFNFSSSGSSSHIGSVNIWLNSKSSKLLSFSKDVSVVKILPVVADILSSGRTSSVVYSLPDGVPLMESTENYDIINESINLSDAYEAAIVDITSSSFAYAKFKKKHKTTGKKIFEAIKNKYPSLIQNTGTAARAIWGWAGTPDDAKKLLAAKEEILSSIGAIRGTVSSGGGENYGNSSQVQAIENDRERLTFEAQLEDMANLLRMTLAGVSNACFIAGRGGIGKTFTTEQILAEGGMSDQNGYFKVTGGSSAAGAYRLLFRHKDDIVVFDDSDDVFADQSSRNILKAATDTKKVRKLVWNKAGKNIIDLKDDPYAEMTPEDILKEGLLPRFFEFTGKIIFISNLSMDKLDPDGALRTRGFIVSIDPTDQEVYDFMRKIAPKMNLEEGLSLGLKERLEVVDMLERGSSKQSANLRKLERGLNMYAGAIKSGVSISKKELTRMIETYA